jgi:hypothetical protein
MNKTTKVSGSRPREMKPTDELFSQTKTCVKEFSEIPSSLELDQPKICGCVRLGKTHPRDHSLPEDGSGTGKEEEEEEE